MQLRGETIVRVMLLIIKRKMIWGISTCKIQQNMRPFNADYRMK